MEPSLNTDFLVCHRYIKVPIIEGSKLGMNYLKKLKNVEIILSLKRMLKLHVK